MQHYDEIQKRRCSTCTKNRDIPEDFSELQKKFWKMVKNYDRLSKNISIDNYILTEEFKNTKCDYEKLKGKYCIA